MFEIVINLEFDVLKLVNIIFWIVKKDLGFIISWRKFVILWKKVFNIILISNMK